MNPMNKSHDTTQLVMPGMAPTDVPSTHGSLANLIPGGSVIYSGNVSGGPHHGVHGFIQRVTNRTAVVNFGLDGTWYIPHFLLSVSPAIPSRAA